jgi:hypothetical protein
VWRSAACWLIHCGLTSQRRTGRIICHVPEGGRFFELACSNAAWPWVYTPVVFEELRLFAQSRSLLRRGLGLCGSGFEPQLERSRGWRGVAGWVRLEVGGVGVGSLIEWGVA